MRYMSSIQMNSLTMFSFSKLQGNSYVFLAPLPYEILRIRSNPIQLYTYLHSVTILSYPYAFSWNKMFEMLR